MIRIDNYISLTGCRTMGSLCAIMRGTEPCTLGERCTEMPRSFTCRGNTAEIYRMEDEEREEERAYFIHKTKHFFSFSELVPQ